MSQASQFFSYSAANIADNDLAVIDACLDALFSNNSGAGAPTGWGSRPGMSWYDTSLPTAPGGLLKHVNSAGGGWYGIFSGSSSFKIWTYLDSLTAEEGWVRDSSVTDMVLALKSTSGIYATGGQVAASSSWTISGFSTESSHTHGLATHSHTLDKGSLITVRKVVGTPVYLDEGPDATGLLGQDYIDDSGSSSNIIYQAKKTTVSGGTTSTNSNSGHTHTQDGAWRIRAAVGIMVYCDV